MFSIDNERKDIALEFDRQQDQIRENYNNRFHIPISDCPFAEEGEGDVKISEIVESLAQRGGGRALYYNHQIEWDVSLEDAIDDLLLKAIYPDGWDYPLADSEDILIDERDLGHEFEITVTLFHHD